MKTLLVAAAPVAGSVDLVARLAAESDFVIAVDGGGGVCFDAGVHPDVVLGDFDSLSPQALDRLRAAGSRIVEFPADKNQTDLELALEVARSHGAESVMVTAAASGRLDHTLGALGALAGAADLRPELIEPSMNAYVLGETGRRDLDVGHVGATISLIAWGGSCSVTVSGVRWPLKSHPLSADSGLGISNIVTADEAHVEIESGRLLVILPEV